MKPLAVLSQEHKPYACDWSLGGLVVLLALAQCNTGSDHFFSDPKRCVF